MSNLRIENHMMLIQQNLNKKKIVKHNLGPNYYFFIFSILYYS